MYQLNSTGRFEYYERSISLKEWIRIHPIWTVLISIILLIVIIYLVANYVNKQTRLIILYSVIGVAIVLLIVYWDDVIKFISGLVAILIFAFIGSAFDRAYSSDNINEEEKAAGKKIIGHAGYGKRVNPKTGVIQEEGLLGWVDTDKRIDPETGNYQKEGLFGWNDTETRIDQESGIIQKEGLIDYIDTDTRINPETGIIQKKGLLGWVDTDKRIDPETGKSQHEGLLGWVDD